MESAVGKTCGWELAHGTVREKVGKYCSSQRLPSSHAGKSKSSSSEGAAGIPPSAFVPPSTTPPSGRGLREKTFLVGATTAAWLARHIGRDGLFNDVNEFVDARVFGYAGEEDVDPRSRPLRSRPNWQTAPFS